MPELPEVETTCRGITPHVVGQIISSVVLRRTSLRWPIPSHLPKTLSNQKILTVKRRAKYLLLETVQGTLIIHLGMSGSLQLVDHNCAVKKHDHVDICLHSGKIIRLNDPRRFGAVLWADEDVMSHKLLCDLGPEPLSDAFCDDWLYMQSRGKRQAVKTFIMNNKIVVGVGNIYATEALFMAGIRPDRSAGGVSKEEYVRLTNTVKHVLKRAIECGGTTLKDFLGSDGKPGYFAIELSVYGKQGLPCPVCRTPIQSMKLGQRSSCFCPKCQR